MKRIMYISTIRSPLSDEEIRAIGQVASRNNKQVGVTGILIAVHDFFFQILEGDESTLDRLVEKIRQDRRHKDLKVLNAESDIAERMFPIWNMRTIRLDEANGVILQAIRMMLQNITQSHRVIERYTQPSVLKFLEAGINPLTVPVKKTEKIVLFADIVGFSYLADKFPVEEVAEVVNIYLETCSTLIVRHGGEVAKYVGDCVIAYFPPDGADAAIAACLDALLEFVELRKDAERCRLLKFLYGGFGLSAGTVIEGNFGSSIKLDYTSLGGTVNIAARLESLTREVGRAIAMSERIRRNAGNDWSFEDLGEFTLKGQEQPARVYSLADPVVRDFKNHQILCQDMQQFCEI